MTLEAKIKKLQRDNFTLINAVSLLKGRASKK